MEKRCKGFFVVICLLGIFLSLLKLIKLLLRVIPDLILDIKT